ncbi:hypothetical protein LTR10_015548 [Elasticomyces elasticus]|uniref:AB hydrolase-1 domain-containing protein n=1 Tax=Exophiala sideris TaxID=1016849 RepID=A0ABR0JKW8_9EURO|nr:hypothetical protein LTR10_015548 [Elasticomyces elasticus]KAK5032259.1 hypothetical protein LTR13_007477 [Exophiala sideris]KAK5036257.1 hypothetical protein LTS07_001983 [Exophiala sideris]KAK5066640.1 hypothetical protein LTR69_001987 [Exophiala sideris]KAK5180462.1 hypothetical protein LTR44_007220 [Eurotiomycetes sp. CCFEE 6388]
MRRMRVPYAQPFRRPFSSTHIRRDVVDLAFHRHDPPEQTKGPPIILMHGLFGSQRNNRTMIYTLDLRNHGESPHSQVHDYTSMAQDVEHFLSAQSIAKPTLIGHSMGAKVAMTMALRSPSKYSALIPVDNAPVDAALKSDFGTYVKAMREIEEHRPPVPKQSEADKILAKYENDTSIRQFLLTNLVKTTPGGAEHQHKQGEHRHPQKTELRWRIPLHTLAKSLPAMADFPFKDPDEARFEGPTLIVRGTKSHYVADDTLPLIGRFFPQFEVLDCDCGHWVMSEKFEEFRKGVVEWITRVVDER